MGSSRARRLLLLGVLAPLVFLLGVIIVSWSERDFMAELGWHQWPSGTALGPNGWATVLTFLLTGFCMVSFGWGSDLNSRTLRGLHRGVHSAGIK